MAQIGDFQMVIFLLCVICLPHKRWQGLGIWEPISWGRIYLITTIFFFALLHLQSRSSTQYAQESIEISTTQRTSIFLKMVAGQVRAKCAHRITWDFSFNFLIFVWGFQSPPTPPDCPAYSERRLASGQQFCELQSPKQSLSLLASSFVLQGTIGLLATRRCIRYIQIKRNTCIFAGFSKIHFHYASWHPYGTTLNQKQWYVSFLGWNGFFCCLQWFSGLSIPRPIKSVRILSIWSTEKLMARNLWRFVA